jgi:HlyD family secretion protein
MNLTTNHPPPLGNPIPRRSWTKTVAVTLLGSILLALAWFGLKPSPVPVELGLVEIGSIEKTIDDDGQSRIRERYTITAPIAANLVRIELHPGDPVSQNTSRLAILEPTNPSLLDARAKQEAEARVKATQAAVDRAEEGIAMASEALELAQHEFERAKTLFDSQSISTAEFDQAEHRYRTAIAEQKSAKFLRTIAQHEQSIALAALQANQTDANSHPLEILSPINGTVLKVLREDAGFVSPGTPLLEIGDPREIEIEIDVLSSAAVAIRPGNPVRIERWGNEQTLSGHVRRIEPSAFLKISALGVEEKRVNVLIDIDQPWDERKELGDGFRVEARIVVDSSDPKALFIPTSALERQGNAWFVYRHHPHPLRSATVERVEVSVGLKNRDYTEITNGLQAGQEVVLYPPEKLRHNQRVTLYKSDK